MSDNWIVQNLNSALSTWSEKMAELWTLLTENPATFKGGGTPACRRPSRWEKRIKRMEQKS